MDERIKKEIARLKAGPQTGYFTFLHHEKPVEESSNLFERIDYILADKPVNEIYDRLRHIYPVTATAEKAYQKATAPAWKAVLAVIPNCAWDGKSIFGGRK